MGTAPIATTQFIGTVANTGIIPGLNTFTIGANVFIDLGNGTLSGGTGGSTINYNIGQVTLNFAALGAPTAVTATYSYNDLNYRVFKVTFTTQNTFQIASVNPDGSLSSFNAGTFGAPYNGFGILQVINNFQARTKRFSPYLQGAAGIRMNYTDLFLKRADGSFLTEVLSDQDSSRVVRTLTVSSEDEVFTGLSPEKLWKRVFVNAISGFIQIQMRMSDFQMTQFQNYSSEWELHAMNLQVAPAGRITGGV